MWHVILPLPFKVLFFTSHVVVAEALLPPVFAAEPGVPALVVVVATLVCGSVLFLMQPYSCAKSSIRSGRCSPVCPIMGCAFCSLAAIYSKLVDEDILARLVFAPRSETLPVIARRVVSGPLRGPVHPPC